MQAAVASSRAAAEAAHKARLAAEKAQEYAELARSHAEGAAGELLVAKKAEVQVCFAVAVDVPLWLSIFSMRRPVVDEKGEGRCGMHEGA